MKLKRFVAIVISFAMVLSIVPSFSLTASAAEEVVLFDATTLDRTSSTGDIALSEGNWSGDWGAVFSNNWGNNTGTWGSNGPTALMFFRTGGRGNGSSDTKTATYGGASASAGANKITISFRYAIQNVSNCYQTWYFRDIDGTNFARFYGDKNTDGGTASVGLNTQSTFVSSGGTLGIRGQEFSIVATQGASNWTVEYYQGTTLLNTDTVTSINGFGSIQADIPQWNDQWAAAGMQGLKITYEIPDTAKDIVATYTVDGTTVNTVSKTIDTSLTDSASFDAYYYSAGNGTNIVYGAAAQTLTDSTTIEMSAVENWSEYAVGDEFTNNGTPYVVKSTNLIPNGDFSLGKAGWYTGISTAMADGFSLNGDGTAKGINNNGTAGASSIWRAWATESGKTYLLTFDSSATSGYYVVSEKSDLSATSDGTVVTTAVAGTNTVIYTATQPYLLASFRWMNGASAGNFGLYEVEVDSSKMANTTIKFVDSSDKTTEIKDAVTIPGIVGDVIDLSEYASAITYNGNPYSFDSANSTSYTVVGNNDVVTLTYTTDAYVSFTADAITVIEGNDPIMPTKVTAKTGAGSTTEVSGAVWTGYTGLSAGTHEISGTVTIDGKTINGSTTVTVLSETYTLADTDVPKSSDKTLTFPENISGEFVIEFDYTPSNVQNNWIYISADGALWGAGQIGIGTNNDTTGKLKAQPSTELGTVESGKTYRMLVTGNASTDTYTLVVTHEDGTTWRADSTFRANSDYINSIRMTPNGDQGAFTVKNIKVHNANSTLKTITIKATGSVDETITVKAASAEVAPIPHYDGHIMKTRSISGNTVTATYEETEYSIGSWYMRNNFTDDNWISQSKYIGSHNAFADDDTVFDNEGGELYGDDATNGSSVYVSKSRTQSVGVLDQLNAGVRYFDIRLSRQEDGTFATVHGPAFENFRDVAISMAQWAKENPGEVIILDFQTTRDALYGGSATGHYTVITDNDAQYGPKEGDDNAYVYAALVELLKDTGLTDYMTTNWDRKYGALTNSGTVTAILPFAKGRAVNCQGSYFINRAALNNDVTYKEASSYSDIVSNLNSTYSSLSDGATISTIHAYTTPGILSATSLLSAASSNNPNWISEDNFYNWMAYGKGDVLLMDDSVSDIDIYYAALNSFNRTGANSSSTFNGAFTRTENGVTINGAQANVPYSTKWTVNSGDASAVGTITIDGVEYTPVTAYTLDLMQFNRDSVQPTGTVNVTFPMVSDGSTTVDVLLSSDGTTVYQVAEVGKAISIDTTSLTDVILATMAAPGKTYTVNYVADGTTFYTKTESVPYGQVVYSVPAGGFYFEADGKAWILNSAAAASHTAADTDTTTTFNVEVTIVSANAVLKDTFGNNDGSNDCNNTANKLFAGSAGVSDAANTDADNAATFNGGGNVGGPRIPLLMFNVPEVADGQRVKLNLYVAEINGNLGVGGTMKLAANVSDVTVDETLGYKAADIANTTGIVWSDTMVTQGSTETRSGVYNCDQWITIDVTEFVKAATSDTITFTLYAPTAGAYVADREKAVAGGTYAGKAAYLEVVDGYTVTVTGASKVTRNGNLVDSTTEVEAYEGAQIKLYETSDATPAFTNGTKVYATDNTTGETGYITVTGADEYYAATVGVAMVDGAQVRIGDGVNTDGTVAGDSGLRFITTVNYSDSLATVEGATFGVEITAEASENKVTVEATSWQDGAAKTVFTTALTNLAVSNYNRNFTATPYVIVDGQTFYGTSVTRSIYQVASGLLATGYNGNYGEDADETGKTDYTTMSDVLIAVLNGYVNQTGVRLVIEDGVLAKSDKYTGDADTFFTVTETSYDEATCMYTCTLTAVGDAEINTGLFSTYVRINNNNSSINTLVTIVDNGNGTYTLTFDASSLATSTAE